MSFNSFMKKLSDGIRNIPVVDIIPDLVEENEKNKVKASREKKLEESERKRRKREEEENKE